MKIATQLGRREGDPEDTVRPVIGFESELEADGWHRVVGLPMAREAAVEAAATAAEHMRAACSALGFTPAGGS